MAPRGFTTTIMITSVQFGLWSHMYICLIIVCCKMKIKSSEVANLPVSTLHFTVTYNLAKIADSAWSRFRVDAFVPCDDVCVEGCRRMTVLVIEILRSRWRAMICDEEMSGRTFHQCDRRFLGSNVPEHYQFNPDSFK